jgi:hypothetical protein
MRNCRSLDFGKRDSIQTRTRRLQGKTLTRRPAINAKLAQSATAQSASLILRLICSLLPFLLERNPMDDQRCFCESCGTPLKTGARFCGACGEASGAPNALPQDNVAESSDGISPANSVETEEGTWTPELTWDFKMPLLTNRFVLYDMIKLLGWSYVIPTAILSAVFLIQGETDALLPFFKMFGYIILGIALLIIFFLAVVFGNRFPYRFVIAREGFLQESLSRRSRFFNRVAVVAGLLTGRMQAVGAGMIAASQETTSTSWEDIHKIKGYPNLCVISLMNSWRVISRIYCTRENYGRIAQTVQARVSEGEQARRQKALLAKPSVVPLLLKCTGGVVLALCLITAIPYPFDIQGVALSVAIIALLLAIWIPFLSRFAGAIAALAVVYQSLLICVRGFGMRQMIPDSVLNGMPAPEWSKYQLWSVLNKGEWIRFGLTVGGLAILMFIAVRALRGSLRPRHEG